MSTVNLDTIRVIKDVKSMDGGSKTKSRLECRHRKLGGETKKGNQLYITESLGIYMASPTEFEPVSPACKADFERTLDDFKVV